MFALISYLFLALFVSFMCSIMESVLLSTPQSFFGCQTGQGRAMGQLLPEFKAEHRQASFGHSFP